MTDSTQTFEFQAEARQLLDLMVHSVYSNKDIFLRELISNSSDALDRLRFEGVSKPELLPESELRILIEVDKEKRILTVRDNGIGMSRDEVVTLIGTIAKSGTKEFLAAMKQLKEEAVPPELIGQFGVGFYSSFMVADKVVLETRRAGEEGGTRWTSEGQNTYTLEDVSLPECGAAVTLHLKPADAEDGLQDYTEEWVIRDLVKRYSDFVAYPIQMEIERTEVERDEEGNPKDGAEPTTVRRLETLNSMKALWLRDKDEVSADEFNEFYKHIAHDWNDPLHCMMAKIEGTLEYRLLLYVPSKAPFDLFMRDGQHGVHLYVKRVFIMDDCKVLLPEYLRFVRGVVDSEDLSLNISREMLQQNRQIQRMRKGITSKVLEELKKLKNNETETYHTFWSEFGAVVKEGLFQDPDNREALLEVALFDSTASEDESTTFAAYADRMREEQDAIYYMTGESREAVEQSPHIEAFKDRGYEVLILTDRVDEVWTQAVTEYNGKPLLSVGKGAVELGSKEEKEKAEAERREQQQVHASLLECLKTKLDEYVKEVRLSNRLTRSPACLVTEEGDLSPQLEQMLRAANQPVPKVKRILEVNPDHPVLDTLHALYDANPDAPELGDYAQLLYGQAVLAENGELPHPAAYGRLVADLMVKAAKK